MGFIKPHYLPNFISVLRGLLIIPVLFSLSQAQYGLAFYLVLIAGLSDGLDGLLARRYGWLTRFGSIADPIADKLLLLSTLAALACQGLVPLWLFGAVVLRDVWVVGGAITYHYWVGRYEMMPSLMSKVNTFLQIILILSILFDRGLLTLSETFLNVVMYLTFISAVWSGVDYTWVWGKRACDATVGCRQ